MFLKRFQLGLIKLEPRSAPLVPPIFAEADSAIIGNEEMRKWGDERGATTRSEAYTVKQMTSAITANPVARTFFTIFLSRIDLMGCLICIPPFINVLIFR